MTKKCCSQVRVSKIKLDDPRSRQAVFLNPGKDLYTKHKVDQCLVSNSVAADWILSKPRVGDLIVELKGKNVEHAVDQVIATANFWKSKGNTGPVSALIVSNEYPRSTTKIQRAQQRMLKDFQSPLHVATGNREYIFERVMSFKGPN
jgi:hypothetical protein